MSRGVRVKGSPSPVDPIVEVRNLGLGFPRAHGGEPVVRDVTFALRPGETVALVGESGSGKTLISLALLGLVAGKGARFRPGSSVRVDGVELARGGGPRVRRLRGGTVGKVFQDGSGALNPVRRIRAQLREVVERHLPVDAGIMESHLAGLLSEVGLEDPAGVLDAYPHQLSGGMRQRVLVALALAGEPRVLVADEPTSALDATLQLQILDLLAQLTRARNLATLLVTHDFGVVARASDRVLVLYGGELVESGPTGPVLEAPAHPYTRGLLAALPSSAEPGRPLAVIPGRMPEPGDRRSGCLFRARCPLGDGRCRERPPWTDVVRDRGHRCWHPGGGDR